MKLIGAILFRLVLYGWLSMWVLLRVHAYPPVLGYILPGALSVVILMSVLLSFYPYDKNLVKIIVNNKKYMVAFFIVLGLIWGQILYEWLLTVQKHKDNHESYLHYEILIAVMGLPSSIIVMGFSILLDPIPGLSYSTWPHKTLVWLTYFIPAFIQFYLIYRWLRKKWSDTANP